MAASNLQTVVDPSGSGTWPRPSLHGGFLKLETSAVLFISSDSGGEGARHHGDLCPQLCLPPTPECKAAERKRSGH